MTPFLALALVVAVRLLPWGSVLGSEAGPLGVAFAGPDEWVHFHRARSWAETGEIPALDPAYAAPTGLEIHWPRGYDAMLGAILRRAGPRGPIALAFVPLFGALLAAGAAYFGARRLRLPPVAAVGIFALVPAGVHLTALGAIDHHAFESGLFWTIALLAPRRPVAAGLGLGLAFAITPSAPIFAGVYLAVLLARALGASPTRPRADSIRDGVLVASFSAMGSGIERASFDAPSLLGILLFAGAGFLVAGVARRREGEAGLLGEGVLLLSAALPAAVALLATGGGYLFRADPWLGEVAEARPLLSLAWRSPFQAIALLSPGLLALPALVLRGRPETRIPTLAALALALLQIRYAHLLAVPAAWGVLLLVRFLARKIPRIPAAPALFAAFCLLPVVRPILATRELAPGIPRDPWRLVARSSRHLPSGVTLLARWDLSPYAVALARARVVTDGFHRNPEGRLFYAEALLAPVDTGAKALAARGVRAVLLTEPTDGFLVSRGGAPRDASGWEKTLAVRLYRGEVPWWREVDREGDARLFIFER